MPQQICHVSLCLLPNPLILPKGYCLSTKLGFNNHFSGAFKHFFPIFNTFGIIIPFKQNFGHGFIAVKNHLEIGVPHSSERRSSTLFVGTADEPSASLLAHPFPIKAESAGPACGCRTFNRSLSLGKCEEDCANMPVPTPFSIFFF